MTRLVSTVASVVGLAFATPAYADGFFAANTHVLVGEESVLTGEYAWAQGSLSGFGFVDKSLDNDFVITDHEVRAEVAGRFYGSVEGGYNRFGGVMGKVGVGINLTGLPVVRKRFTYLRVYAQHTVFGPDAKRILGASWGTKDVPITNKVSVYASGFADIKRNAPDVIQPQLWLKFEGTPIEIGTELSVFGRNKTFSLAGKFKF